MAFTRSASQKIGVLKRCSRSFASQLNDVFNVDAGPVREKKDKWSQLLETRPGRCAKKLGYR